MYISAEKVLAELFEISLEDGPSDEMFALDRCKSRLIEMQSQKYMQEAAYHNLIIADTSEVKGAETASPKANPEVDAQNM